MDQTLMMLARDVRAKTLRILEGLTDEQARFKASGLNNSILWHAGHAYVVVEHLAAAPITGSPDLPEGWFDTFSWKSNPAAVMHWPALADIRTRLAQQLERLLPLFESLTDAQLGKVLGPAGNRTLRYSILHGFHDEACHQGEMWLLRKMLQRANH